MDKAILRQALKFQNNAPRHNEIEKLYNLATTYQEEHQCYFINSQRGSRATILSNESFFKFISTEILKGKNITSFQEIEEILKPATSRKENISITGDSKNNIVKIFSKVIVCQQGGGHPILYKDTDELKINIPIVAVENGETFLNIYNIFSKFGFNNFIYLGGYGNRLTRDFLKDKEVVFF